MNENDFNYLLDAIWIAVIFDPGNQSWTILFWKEIYWTNPDISFQIATNLFVLHCYYFGTKNFPGRSYL